LQQKRWSFRADRSVAAKRIAYFRSSVNSFVHEELLCHAFRGETASSALKAIFARQVFWLLVPRFWPGWKQALPVVTPKTVVRRQRAGFRWYRALISKVRKPIGRRPTPKVVRDLIFRMVTEKPTYGAPRIHGNSILIGANNKGSKPCAVRVRDSARRKGKSFAEPFQLRQFVNSRAAVFNSGPPSFTVRGTKPPPIPPVAGVGWRISGKYHHGSKLHDSCSATFEPFDGKLLVVAETGRFSVSDCLVEDNAG